MLVPLTRPTLRRKDYNSVLNCLVSDLIAPGPLAQEFGSSLSRLLGAAAAFGLVNYRSCIHCAFDCLELKAGDEVLVSALAPKEYLQVIEARGLVAVVADVEEGRPLLSGERVQPHLSSGLKAIVLSYTLGALPESEEIFGLGVPVVEDVTQAVGGQWDGRPCGGRGRMGVMSLNPGGLITAGCGGVVFSRDRRHGRALKDLAAGEYADQLLPDMNAALGVSQVRELPRFLDKRRQIESVFREALLRSPHGPLFGEGERVDFAFPVLVKHGRREVRQYAAKRGVETEPAFKDAVVAIRGGSGAAAGHFPNAETLLWRCLLFPLYPSLARKDVQLICRVLSTLP
jgi:perosamine synthetase